MSGKLTLVSFYVKGRHWQAFLYLKPDRHGDVHVTWPMLYAAMPGLEDRLRGVVATTWTWG